jgi:hypothetical protein
LKVPTLTTAELATRVDALLQADNFGLTSWKAPGEQTTFTYKFEIDATADFRWTDVGGGFTGFSAAEVATFRTALAHLSEFTNISFVELDTSSSANADISFFKAFDLYLNDPSSTGGGRGRWQYQGDQWNGQAVFNAARDLSAPHEFDFVLHEIGHALGLKHPGDYDVGGNNPPGPFLPTAEDNEQYTLMSYIREPGQVAEPNTYMLYDYAALQSFWGANTATRTGSDVYTTVSGAPRTVIWDAAGVDAIYSNTAGAVTIDLRQGAFSSINGSGDLVVAYGSVIETAIGGSGSDQLVGNETDNLLIGNGGNDTIYAGAGFDTVRFTGDRSEYTVVKETNGSYTVTDAIGGRDGVDIVWDADRLEFRDQIVNLGETLTLPQLFAANPNTAMGLASAYEVLQAGVPNEAGFSFLINSAVSTNFGAGAGVVFNQENIFINLVNNLVQGNADAKARFDALATGSSLQEKVTSLYNSIIPASQQSADGLAFITRADGLKFYQDVAAERGVAGTDGAAIVSLASLLKIAVTGDFGIGNSVNDLVKAVAAGNAAIPATGTTLTPLETADGTAFDADDAAALARAFTAHAETMEPYADEFEVYASAAEVADLESAPSVSTLGVQLPEIL